MTDKKSNQGSYTDLDAKWTKDDLRASAADLQKAYDSLKDTLAPAPKVEVETATIDTPTVQDSDRTDLKQSQEESEGKSFMDYDTSEEVNHNWEKRAKDGQRYINQLKEEAKAREQAMQARLQELEEQLLVKKQESLPKTAEDLAAFKEENPDMYDIMYSLVERSAIEKDAQLKKQMELLRIKQHEIERKEKYAQLASLGHPDAESLRPDLMSWLETQTPGTKALFSSDDVRDWAEGFTKFKQATGIIKSKAPIKEKKTDESILPDAKTKVDTTQKQGKIWRQSEISKLSDDEYIAKRDEIRQAVSENRFIYDVTLNT